MNLSHSLISAAERTPTAPALFTATQMVAAYAKFADQPPKYAVWLAAPGLEAGDRVEIYRPLINDPKALRRERAAVQRAAQATDSAADSKDV